MAESIQRITILGTGLIGASVGLALRAHGFRGTIFGWDRERSQAAIALSRGAIDEITGDPATTSSDLILLAGPVSSTLEWIDQLAPVLLPDQIVTDVGSVKAAICERASRCYNGPGQPSFLPGHPMAGKEVCGAVNADAALFVGAVWLFTPPPDTANEQGPPRAREWRGWVKKFGCRVLDLEPLRHDELCAWVSHMPQMVATAMSAMLQERFSGDDQMQAIGGRALREMTRLGASPYSMWRDIAHINADPIASSLHALEQTLAHLRENLKTPELRALFEQANEFRATSSPDRAAPDGERSGGARAAIADSKPSGAKEP